LSIKDSESNVLTTLQSLSMDLGGEDASSMMKSVNVQKWDKRKKKYITTSVGGDPYKKQRNEAGELIRMKDTPDLYAKWQKSQKKTAQLTSLNNMMEESDNEQDGNNNNTKS